MFEMQVSDFVWSCCLGRLTGFNGFFGLFGSNVVALSSLFFFISLEIFLEVFELL